MVESIGIGGPEYLLFPAFDIFDYHLIRTLRLRFLKTKKLHLYERQRDFPNTGSVPKFSVQTQTWNSVHASYLGGREPRTGASASLSQDVHRQEAGTWRRSELKPRLSERVAGAASCGLTTVASNVHSNYFLQVTCLVLKNVIF